MAGAGAIALAAGSAQAQSALALSQSTIQVDIARTSLAKALFLLGRQAGVPIVFLPDRVKGRQAVSLHGRFTVEQALERLLNGTGLRYQRLETGAYAVGGPTAEAYGTAVRKAEDMVADAGIASGKIAVPEILVKGKKDWTLNLDIPRTVNDAQPYVIFDHEQIARSGATNLDDFFRDYLGASTTGSTSSQRQSSDGQSSINLRGLGTAGTLILVDGRRYTEANTGSGAFGQSSINGIPLDAIERVEVLASSASGIYGGNAVGGVINIIMRRDYHGLEATAYYGNTTDFADATKRFSLNGSFPLEHGRTRLSFTASWQRAGALDTGERGFTDEGRARILEYDPNYFSRNNALLASSLPNIMGQNGAQLILKPQYGGTALGSNVTSVPAGYQGIAVDGVAALVANAGKQNMALAPTPDNQLGGAGALSRLLSPSQSYDGSLTLRREFNHWLSAYAEFNYSRYESYSVVNPASGVYTLAASDPNNPFQEAINVYLPVAGQEKSVSNISTNMRALAGAIVKLPFNWSADIDLNWNWGRFQSEGGPAGLDLATTNGINNGTIDILRDVSQYPIDFGYLDIPASSGTTPSHSFARSYTLKLAGPAPWLRLPGGKPVITVLLEQDKQSFGDAVSYTDTATASNVEYTPERSQRTDSVYGEVRFPIVGQNNHVPLIRELELQVAGRYDHYVGVGANAGIQCFPTSVSQPSYPGPLPDGALDTACPPNGVQPAYATTRNGSLNPTVALRWAVSRDITFRGSYSTGYQPPFLNQVIKQNAPIAGGVLNMPNAGVSPINVTDPLRDNEAIGTPYLGVLHLIPATLGGNPDVTPQTSTSWSFGTIVTPHFVPGLRLSVDYTRIIQHNLYFSPYSLLNMGNTPGGQQEFDDFLAAHPERFIRGPASDGYSVGPITFIDASTANMSLAKSEALDFTGSYQTKLGKGTIDFEGSATWLLKLATQTTPTSQLVDGTGVVSATTLSNLIGLGGIEWKANGSVIYSTSKWSIGWRVRYFGGYWLMADHSVVASQGSARIPAQIYNDIFGSYKIFDKTELRVGVNNVLDHHPPIDTTAATYYSEFGDPRLTNFYLSISQKF